jgi:hypothetical protein
MKINSALLTKPAVQPFITVYLPSMCIIFGPICNSVAKLFDTSETDRDPATNIDQLAFRLLTAIFRVDQSVVETTLQVISNVDWFALEADEQRTFELDIEQDNQPIALIATSEPWFYPTP